MKEIPYILSLAHKEQIDSAVKNLRYLGFEYFVMYIVFNNGAKFVLSNIYHMLTSYYTDDFYKHDFSFRPEIICRADYYLCDRTNSVTEEFKEVLENKFNVCRAYYIIRNSPECTFVFGAIKDRKIDSYVHLYQSTIKDFEKFCFSFVDSLSSVISKYNPSYKNAFIFTNRKYLQSVITRDYSAFGVKLSDREIECLWLASKGYSSKAVANALNISPLTVETHNKNIRRKFECSTMVEAVVEGIQRGFIGKINPYSSQEETFAIYQNNTFNVKSNIILMQQDIITD